MNPFKFIWTIRAKLFLIFFFSIVFLVTLSFVLNTFFLESFYIEKNQDMFVKSAGDVTAAYNDNMVDMEQFIEAYGKTNEINIDIIKKDLKVEYSSIAKRQNGEDLPKEVEDVFNRSIKRISEKYTYEVISNDKKESASAKIIYISKLPKGRYLLLSKPLKGIRESVKITNQFAVVTGFITIVLGGLITLIVTNRATVPILEMNQVAEQISMLNFGDRVEVKSKDEIAMLGNSINTISDKLSISIAELKTDVERRKRLVRDISHELKTPIGVIKGYTEGLKYGVAETPEMIDKYIDTIIKECNQMDTMVKEMIELSRYEYCEKKLDVEEIRVSLIFETIAERFAPIFEKELIEYEEHGDFNAVVNGDFKLVVRVISNYLTNAIRHVNDNKKITLSIEVVNTESIISVFNTGQKIEVQDFEKLWDVFYKTTDDRSPNMNSGSGIGLSIVKQIAELHGGSVGVENVSDGVKFYLKLPR